MTNNGEAMALQWSRELSWDAEMQSYKCWYEYSTAQAQQQQESTFLFCNLELIVILPDRKKMTKIDWGRLLGEGVFDLTITVHINIIIIRVAEKSLWSWFDI